MNALKGILGENADEKIQSILSTLKDNSDSDNSRTDSILPTSENNNTPTQNSFSSNLEMLEYAGKLKAMVDNMDQANDSRSNLLLSLKPYMRSKRQKSIDSAIRLLNLSKLTGLFKL